MIEVARAGEGELVCPEALLAASSVRKRTYLARKGRQTLADGDKSQLDASAISDGPAVGESRLTHLEQSLAPDIDVTGISLFTVEVTSPVMEYYIIPKTALHKYFQGAIRENFKERFFNNLAHRTKILQEVINWDFDPRLSDYFEQNQHEITNMEPLQEVLYKESFPAAKDLQVESPSKVELLSAGLRVKRSMSPLKAKAPKFNPQRISEVLTFGGANQRPLYDSGFQFVPHQFFNQKKRTLVSVKTARISTKKPAGSAAATTRLPSTPDKGEIITIPGTVPTTARDSQIPSSYNFVFSAKPDHQQLLNLNDQMRAISQPSVHRPATTGVTGLKSGSTDFRLPDAHPNSTRKLDYIAGEQTQLANWFRTKDSARGMNTGRTPRIYLPFTSARVAGVSFERVSGKIEQSTSTDNPPTQLHSDSVPLSMLREGSSVSPNLQHQGIESKIQASPSRFTRLLTRLVRSNHKDEEKSSLQQSLEEVTSFLLKDQHQRSTSLHVLGSQTEDSFASIPEQPSQVSKAEPSKNKMGFCHALKKRVMHNQQCQIADQIKLSERSIFCPTKPPLSTRKLLRVMDRAKRVGLSAEEIARVISNTGV